MQNKRWYRSEVVLAKRLWPMGTPQTSCYLFVETINKNKRILETKNFVKSLKKSYKMELQSLKRSNEFTTNYVEYVQQCFLVGKFCDLKIQTSLESSIDCHKSVLSSVFPHLKELLEQVTGLSLLQFESFKS